MKNSDSVNSTSANLGYTIAKNNSFTANSKSIPTFEKYLKLPRVQESTLEFWNFSTFLYK